MSEQRNTQTGTQTSKGNGEREITFVIDDDSFFENRKGAAPAGQGNFLEIATALAQGKWFIGKVALAAAVTAAIVALLLPNRYTSSTKILPPQQSQSSAGALLSSLGGSGVGSLASAAGKDLGIKNPNDLYVGMLKSRSIADAIIQHFDLQKSYGAKDMTDARKELADRTEIVSEKEGFISVAVEDKQKKRAMDMANGYVEELRNMTRGLALTESSQRRLFYEQQLKQAKNDLADAEVAFTAAQHKSGLLQLDAQSKEMIEAVGKLRAEIVGKQVRLQTIRSFATDKNPEVEIAQQELAQLKLELNKLEKSTGSPESYEVTLKDVPQAGAEYVRSAREVKFHEALFEILAKQYEAARMDEAKDAPVIQVVDLAIEPDRKSSPKRAVMVILSAIAGLFLGCLITVVGRWKRMIQMDPLRAEQLKGFRAAMSSSKASSQAGS